MHKVAALIFIFLFSKQPVFATILQGQHPDYAGKKVAFAAYTDPVTQEKKELFTIEFDDSGNFKTEIPVDETTYVFSDFGIYRGMLFLEPNKTMKLRFPPLREKSFADAKNPYFEPVQFWFATENGQSLNDKISAFDQKLNNLTDKNFNRLYFRHSKEVFDSISTALNNQFEGDSPETFKWHKQFRIKLLKTDVFRLNTSSAAPFLAEITPAFWSHPAFIELFDKLFSNQLSFESKSVDGIPLRKAVAEGNTDFLLNFIREKYQLKGDVVDLAALKMLYDGFYSGDFPQNSILKMLHGNRFMKNSNAEIKSAAQQVVEKLEFLLPGTKAPVICLKNIDGFPVCTDQFPEKFKYLIFADTEMIVCREQLKYLKKIEEQFGKYLQIIVILRKTDIIEQKIFLDKQNIPGVKLIDEDGGYIVQYRVRSFPTSILLNEDHEVVFSNTKNPLDGFEQQFGEYLRKELFERQRNQSR